MRVGGPSPESRTAVLAGLSDQTIHLLESWQRPIPALPRAIGHGEHFSVSSVVAVGVEETTRTIGKPFLQPLGLLFPAAVGRGQAPAESFVDNLKLGRQHGVELCASRPRPQVQTRRSTREHQLVTPAHVLLHS